MDFVKLFIFNSRLPSINHFWYPSQKNNGHWRLFLLVFFCWHKPLLSTLKQNSYMGAPFKPWQKKFSDWFGLELVIKPLTKNYNDNTLPFLYKVIAYCLSYNNSYTFYIWITSSLTRNVFVSIIMVSINVIWNILMSLFISG